MSKRFKVGDSVSLVSDSSKVGVVKEKIIKRLSEKCVELSYLVKFGQGLSNWKECNRTELVNVSKPKDNSKTVEYVKTYDFEDGRKLVLTGIVQELEETPNIKLYISRNSEVLKDFDLQNHVVKYKRFSIGHAICNPEDSFNETVGKRIAKKRAMKHPLSSLLTDFKGEFNPTTVEAIMDAKASFISDELDKFINDKVRFSR